MFVFSMLIIAAASCRLFVFGGHFETKGTFIANYENEMLFAHMPTSTYAMTYSECNYFV